MEQKTALAHSPLEGINYHFDDYVKRKKEHLSAHMGGNGLPDYAYSMDYEYRKKLDSIPGLYKNLRRLLIPAIQQQYQTFNMNGVKASPTQFSEIYQMGCDCARILGIGVPTILVVPSFPGGGEFNACSVCVDDQEPLIMVTGLMVQRMTPGELKTIIGHECGHTHNNHAIYQQAAEIIANVGIRGLISVPILSQIAGLLSTGTQALLNMWSRAAETTADRASMICSDSLEDAYSAQKKLIYGGANLSNNVDINLDIVELKKQLDVVNSSPYRYQELMYNHPISVRRVFAEMEFAKCETLYAWRPDLKTPGIRPQSKAMTDEACKKIIGVMKSKEGRLS
ncbi:M48 family metallopeptidase [Ruminococcus sp.]|uniref:M48 family metallopeptidase n=1 Tax=Ruminococcus sp. TaxID=41978 RepID=UPI00388D6188